MNYKFFVTLFLFVINTLCCASENVFNDLKRNREQYHLIKQEFTNLVVNRQKLGQESLFHTQPEEFLENHNKDKTTTNKLTHIFARKASPAAPFV